RAMHVDGFTSVLLANSIYDRQQALGVHIETNRAVRRRACARNECELTLDRNGVELVGIRSRLEDEIGSRRNAGERIALRFEASVRERIQENLGCDGVRGGGDGKHASPLGVIGAIDFSSYRDGDELGDIER